MGKYLVVVSADGRSRERLEADDYIAARGALELWTLQNPPLSRRAFGWIIRPGGITAGGCVPLVGRGSHWQAAGFLLPGARLRRDPGLVDRSVAAEMLGAAFGRREGESLRAAACRAACGKDETIRAAAFLMVRDGRLLLAAEIVRPRWWRFPLFPALDQIALVAGEAVAA